MKNFIKKLPLITKHLMVWASWDKKICLIVCLAFGLRIWGLTYGFPFIYPPDESALVKEVLVLPIRYFNPGHFDWPHLHYYLTFILFAPIYVIQLLMNTAPKTLDDSLLLYYFLGRLISTIMGTATVYLVYRLGQKMINKNIGLLAALILALNLNHIQQSQLATTDAPMLFWLTLAFLFLVNIINCPSRRNYAIAGLMIGLATSTKYNAGFAIVILLSIYTALNWKWINPTNYLDLKKSILGLKGFLSNLNNLMISLVMTVVGFLLGTPFALINFKKFIVTTSPQGAFWQFARVTGDQAPLGILEKYYAVFNTGIASSYSWPLVLASLCGAIVCIRKYHQVSYIILPFLIGYFLLVGRFALTPSHYFMPMFPLMSILAAVGLLAIAQWIKSFFIMSIKKAMMVSAVVFLTILTGKALMYDVTLLRKDTRTLAYEWMVANIPAGSGVVVGNDYEPDLKKSPFKIYSIYDVLLNEDLSRPIYPKLNDQGIFHGVLGDYGLDEKQRLASWDPNAPVYPDYLLDKAKVIARFDPVFRPGPTVMVFEIDYAYEVLSKQKENEESN